LTGLRKLPIFPEGEREYFYKAVAAQITFVTDDQRRVSELLLHQNGHDVRAARIGDVPALDRKQASVDPATFDGYVGWYEPPPPRNIATVTRDGDHLFVQETGQARSKLIPRSAVGYVAGGGSGPDILFEPAEQGRPSALILYDEARGAVRATWVDAARARQIEEVAARQIADTPERFKNQMPAAGSEATLPPFRCVGARRARLRPDEPAISRADPPTVALLSVHVHRPRFSGVDGLHRPSDHG
jgi:hypothetical protein